MAKTVFEVEKLIWKIVAVIAAYLVGAINMATIIGKLKGKNIKKLGSGNPGTMNVMRSVGKVWGALTFAFDCAKGVAFALIGRFAIDGGSTDWMFILGTVTIIGHILPVYTKFRGGKGVATTLGMYLVATPIVGPCVLAGLVIYLLFCKIGFIGSYLAVTALTIANCIKYKDSVVAIVCCLIVWVFVIIRHKDNVKRFIKGKENTLSLVGKNQVNENDASEIDAKDIDSSDSGIQSQDAQINQTEIQNQNKSKENPDE